MFRCFPVVFSYIFPLDFPLFLRLLSCPLLVVFRVLTMSSAAVRAADKCFPLRPEVRSGACRSVT